MGDIHWLKDVPLDTLTWDDQHAHVTEATFNRIGDYTRSQPTGPSPGRIYKKALNWPNLQNGGDPNWFIYICEEDPDDPSMVLHRGRPVQLVNAQFPHDIIAKAESIKARFRP